MGQAYLVDFGSVQAVGVNSSATFTVVGTYGYMAPEQFLGRATAASDLYGLGTTLVYLATGSHPVDLMDDDLKVNWQQNAVFSESLQNWVQQLIDPRPSLRFGDATEALRKLKSASVVSGGMTASLLARHRLPPWSGFPWKRCLTVVPPFPSWMKGGLLGIMLGNGLLFPWANVALYGSSIVWGIAASWMGLVAACLIFLYFNLNRCGYSGAWMKWGDELSQSGKYSSGHES